MSKQEKVFVCVLCPNSCEVTVTYEGREVLGAKGNLCPKGRAYAEQELLDPRRTVATSVLVEGGARPLVSVRLTEPVPLADVFPLMEEIKKIRLSAPVEAGQVLMEGVSGTGAKLITTDSVAALGR